MKLIFFIEWWLKNRLKYFWKLWLLKNILYYNIKFTYVRQIKKVVGHCRENRSTDTTQYGRIMGSRFRVGKTRRWKIKSANCCRWKFYYAFIFGHNAAVGYRGNERKSSKLSSDDFPSEKKSARVGGSENLVCEMRPFFRTHNRLKKEPKILYGNLKGEQWIVFGKYDRIGDNTRYIYRFDDNLLYNDII